MNEEKNYYFCVELKHKKCVHSSAIHVHSRWMRALEWKLKMSRFCIWCWNEMKILVRKFVITRRAFHWVRTLSKTGSVKLLMTTNCCSIRCFEYKWHAIITKIGCNSIFFCWTVICQRTFSFSLILSQVWIYHRL